MDHADSQRRCIIGAVDLDLLSVLLDDARFRLVQAEQHAHQRGFARAVFAQQCMDLSSAQLQRDVVVGDDAGELLGDVKHLDDIVSAHDSQPHFLYKLFAIIQCQAAKHKLLSFCTL